MTRRAGPWCSCGPGALRRVAATGILGAESGGATSLEAARAGVRLVQGVPPHGQLQNSPLCPSRCRLEAAYSGNGDERVKWLVYTLEQAARMADEAARGWHACAVRPPRSWLPDLLREPREAGRGSELGLSLAALREVALGGCAGGLTTWVCSSAELAQPMAR